MEGNTSLVKIKLVLARSWVEQLMRFLKTEIQFLETKE
jgi:hypothetical protein